MVSQKQMDIIKSLNRLLFVFLIGTFLISSGCNHQDLSALGLKLTVEKKTLSNGLTILLIEDHTVPIVSYQTWFKVGSVDESAGSTGISHLFEHLMFKGTEKYGPKRFFLELEAKGADVNAYTTRDYTVYYENFVPSMIEKVIDMESDRMKNLKVNDEMLNSERMVVLEERRLKSENSPDGKIQEALWSLAYRHHPYQWPVIGYPQDLISISSAKLQKWFATHYSPENATVVVTGDMNSDFVYSMIKRSYSPIAGVTPPKRKILAEPDQKEERRLVLRDKIATERFAEGYHVTSADHDDSYALDVLSNILFEGTSSRVYKALVEEKELLTQVSGSNFTPAFPGLFMASGTLRPGIRSETGEKSLHELFNQVQLGGVTAEEIQIAIRQLTVQLVDSVRTPYGIGQLVGTVQTLFGDPSRFSKDMAKYMKVTATDVKKVANKYLLPNNRSVVVMIPSSQEPSGYAKSSRSEKLFGHLRK